MKPWQRYLWRRRAGTPEGTAILWRARWLSMFPQYADLTDGQLIRLAYWGATGEREDGQ